MPSVPVALAQLAPAELAAQLGSIFYFIVCPMLVLVAAGFLIQRRVGLDPQTLSRINFNFCVPGIMFYSVVGSNIRLADAAQGFIFTVLMVLGMAALAKLAGRLLRVPGDRHGPLMMGAMYYNAGNYGLPLQDLAFRGLGLSAEARTIEVFVMIGQNITTFTLGIFLASGGRAGRTWRELLREMARFPPLYALAAAGSVVLIRHLLGEDAPAVAKAVRPFWDALGYAKDSFIGLALLTLGAQLALVKPGEPEAHVGLSVVLRLVLGPVLGLGLVYAFGLEGFPAQVLWISSGLPSAVNIMLLCVEFKNHPGYMARVVFFATLLSPLTLTVVIFLAQSGLIARLAGP